MISRKIYCMLRVVFPISFGDCLTKQESPFLLSHSYHQEHSPLFWLPLPLHMILKIVAPVIPAALIVCHKLTVSYYQHQILSQYYIWSPNDTICLSCLLCLRISECNCQGYSHWRKESGTSVKEFKKWGNILFTMHIKSFTWDPQNIFFTDLLFYSIY